MNVHHPVYSVYDHSIYRQGPPPLKKVFLKYLLENLLVPSELFHLAFLLMTASYNAHITSKNKVFFSDIQCSYTVQKSCSALLWHNSLLWFEGGYCVCVIFISTVVMPIVTSKIDILFNLLECKQVLVNIISLNF